MAIERHGTTQRSADLCAYGNTISPVRVCIAAQMPQHEFLIEVAVVAAR